MNARLTRKVAVCAAGMGNVHSVVQALARAAGERCVVEATSDPDTLRDAALVVVPGQGAFGAFAAAIDGPLRDVLLERLAAGRPYLGICLGMQILFASSEEAGPSVPGLGFFSGHVARVAPGIEPATGRPWPLPHLGWNVAASRAASAYFPAEEHFYFAHSYVAVPADAGIVAATTTYGDATFASAVAKGAVLGVQFHPEKSQRAGLGLLQRFVETVVP